MASSDGHRLPVAGFPEMVIATKFHHRILQRNSSACVRICRKFDEDLCVSVNRPHPRPCSR